MALQRPLPLGRTGGDPLNDLYHRTISHFGETHQIRLAMEEMAELIKELNKSLRGKSNARQVAAEMADVYIMLEQLELIYDNGDVINHFRSEKLTRLRARLHELEQGGESV